MNLHSLRTKQIKITFLAALVLSSLALISGILFSLNKASAATPSVSEDITLRLTSSPVISISAPDTVLISIDEPTSAGQFKYSDANVNVSSNNATGYTLTMAAKNSTNLTRAGGGTIATLDAATTQAAFTADRWGFSIDNGSNYRPISTTPTSIGSSDGPVASGEHTVRFGAKVTDNKTPGDYMSVVTFTATMNEPDSFTINYNANGGSGAPASHTEINNYILTISSTIPTRNGIAFLGWSEDSSATSATYQPGDTYTFQPGEPKSINLYAVWQQYTLQYNANGGSGAPSSASDYSKTFTIDSTVPTREDYEFLGWSTNQSATTATYHAGDTYTFTGDSYNATLYAVWQLKSHTIEYNLNGGTGGPSVSTTGRSKTLTIDSAKPTKSDANYDYDFLGWSKEPDATSATYQPGDSFSFDPGSTSVTLYAVWQIKTYTINYNANSGTGAPSATTGNTKTLTISSTQPTRTNYTFQGWGTSSSTSTASYQPGGTYTFTGTSTSVTLYAVWKSNGGGCLIKGDLVNMPDGTKVPVEELADWTDIKAWNFETGSYTVSPITPMYRVTEPQEYKIVYLQFEDTEEIGIAFDHGFFDADLNQFVYITPDNVNDYVGHSFVKIDGDNWTTVKLNNYHIENEITSIYSPVTYEHMNFYVNDMLSFAGGLDGMLNYFEVDPTTMAWDPVKKAADIEQYGLMTVEDFNGIIDEMLYDCFNGRYLGVSMGKGMLTFDDIQSYVDNFAANEDWGDEDNSVTEESSEEPEPNIFEQVVNTVSSWVENAISAISSVFNLQ